jgi:hypothetical protein
MSEGELESSAANQLACMIPLTLTPCCVVFTPLQMDVHKGQTKVRARSSLRIRETQADLQYVPSQQRERDGTHSPSCVVSSAH